VRCVRVRSRNLNNEAVLAKDGYRTMKEKYQNGIPGGGRSFNLTEVLHTVFGYCTCICEIPEGKRPLGRTRHRWEYNIKMDLQEVGAGCEDWMELAHDRDRWRTRVSTVMNVRVPKMQGISRLAAEPVSFSRRTVLYGVSK